MVVFPVSFVRFRGVTSNKHQAFLLEKCEDEVNLKRDDLSRPVAWQNTTFVQFIGRDEQLLGEGERRWNKFNSGNVLPDTISFAEKKV